MAETNNYLYGRATETMVRVLRSLDFFYNLITDTGDGDTYGELCEKMNLTRNVLADNVNDLETALKEIGGRDPAIKWALENINNPGFYRAEEQAEAC